MGKLNFVGILISQFYPTCKIRKKMMHTIVFYSVSHIPWAERCGPIIFVG